MALGSQDITGEMVETLSRDVGKPTFYDDRWEDIITRTPRLSDFIVRRLNQLHDNNEEAVRRSIKIITELDVLREIVDLKTLYGAESVDHPAQALPGEDASGQPNVQPPQTTDGNIAA